MPDGNVPNFLEPELDQLEVDFLARIRLYINHSRTDLGRLIAEIDFFKELQEAGLVDVIGKVEKEYAGIIDSIIKDADKLHIGISGTTLRELDVLMNLDAENILNSAKTYSNQFKSGFIKGIISGQSTGEIVSGLSTIPLKTNQLIASVNTARDEFHAASMADLFSDSPEIRFKLQGPVDNRTRCQCKAVMMFQSKDGFTKQEIDEGSWTRIAKEHCPKFEGEYTFVNRGGFNCRHWIQIARE